MKIRSIKTKLEHTVTKEGWEKIQARGDGSKYVIVSNAPVKENKPPEDTNKADYNHLVKDANRKMGKKDYEGAKKLFEQAQAIKPSTLITEKLGEIQSILDIKE